ncbi:hypothetical protein KUU55_00640 [Pseudomonas aeruginosa]|nr:hypothetical protein [Pseudomonas aeruginosa]
MNERQKAYAVVTLKDLQQDERTFKGIASTPETDRHGDIVVSAGARFKNPVPLLWMHEADKAIGTVEFGKPTVDGIPFTARIPKVDEPGRAQALIKQITEAAREAAKGGVKEAYGVAGVGILAAHLIKALERIERLEGDIKVLTELLANVESSR